MKLWGTYVPAPGVATKQGDWYIPLGRRELVLETCRIGGIPFVEEST